MFKWKLPWCIFHKWAFNKVIYPDLFCEQQDLGDKPQRRYCVKCSKHQVMHSHCLGLNPPEFVVHYQTLATKPHFKLIKGTWEFQ